MAIVAVAATKVSNLQAALIIAVPAVLINASIALSTISSDQIRLAQALLIALSLVVSAVHGLSRTPGVPVTPQNARNSDMQTCSTP